jgi:hypothetical protein
MVDFGADVPFAKASMKLKEHYGIDVPASAIRAVTEKHGAAVLAREKQGSPLPDRAGVAVLIAETDGSMVPVVETAEVADNEDERVDRRKTRKLDWREVKLCLVHPPGSVTPVFGATTGSADEAGEKLWECSIEAGAGIHTKLHGVGDGASWITNQLDLRFGPQAKYLIDFSHLCDYLSAAAKAIAGKDEAAWIEEKKYWLKENRWPEVLEKLRPHLESETVTDTDAPVRACYRYISNRPYSLDYKGALADGLPIGSGEIESAHRYVIQTRLKIAGAWWKMGNVAKMIALRVMRINGHWEEYWKDFDKKAA